jgi:hypothetical protein
MLALSMEVPVILTTALFALIACDASDLQTGDTGYSTTIGDDTGTTGGNTDQDPVIDSADAYCTLHSTGDEFYQWQLGARIDDPQGLDTIELYNTVEVYRGGSLQAEYSLLCPGTSEPPCIGSFTEAQNGILCSSASDYTFKFIISDEDGNTATFEVAGYQG